MKKSIIIIFLFILGTSNILIKSKNTKVTYNKNEIISASYVIPEDTVVIILLNQVII